MQRFRGPVRLRERTDADPREAFEPWVAGDEVVVGIEGELLALDLKDGSLPRTYPVPGLPRGLGASEAKLYVGTLGGKLLALARRGEERVGAREKPVGRSR